MDNSTIAMIATVVLSLVAVFGAGAAFLKGTKIAKEALDVLLAVVTSLEDMKVSAEEVEKVRKEWEEFKALIAKDKK
jgi:divalent metal cation (Fe/Co/Zn/Cd) transporter